MILAIDPGSTESAYVILDNDLKPSSIGKIKNEELLDNLSMDRFHAMTMEFQGEIIEHCAIEMIQSYGMGVGQEVFDTCVWVGRFTERANFKNVKYIYRKEEKMNLCQSTKAKDSNIIQALIDRFAYGVKNKGKGTIKEKGYFYGFAKDIWQAYAVGVTYHDLYIKPQ